MDNSSSVVNRSQWLRRYGFEHDPFESGGWRAEDDKLLKESDEVFYDSLRIEEIISKNCPFIFGVQGSGKTAVKHRIKISCEQSIQFGVPDGILTIDYDSHDYLEYSLDDHVSRFVDLINHRLRNLIGKYSVKPNSSVRLNKSKHSSYKKLEEINEQVKKMGFQKFLVLVDNIDADSKATLNDVYRKIEALITHSDVLRLDLFRFFLPIRKNNIRDIPIRLPFGKFPYRMIEWKEDELDDLYKKRLNGCLIRDRKDATLSNLGSFLCEDDFKDLDSKLVNFGFRYGMPRAIWRLGHEIIERHFRQFPKSMSPADSKITFQIYNQAKESMEYLLDSENFSDTINHQEIARQLQQELISSLLDFEPLKDLQNRKAIVSSLSNEIQNNIKLDQTPRIDLSNIVHACVARFGGVTQLYESLASNLGKSLIGLQEFKQLVDKYNQKTER